MVKTFEMLGLVCLMALIIELDFFTALPKFGAEHFGAPDDLKKLVKNIPDPPIVQVICGIIILVLGFAGVVAAFVWAGIDTYRNYSGFLPTFVRFLIILEGYKLFDVVCFDWLLMTKIRFPEKVYPQTKGAKGYDSFGFNAKSQITKAIAFAFVALIIAFVFSLICR